MGRANVDDDDFGLGEAENCAALAQRALDRLDMIIAEAPIGQARKLMVAATHLQHALDLLDQSEAA